MLEFLPISKEQTRQRELLLFFHGWGMDVRPLLPFLPKEYDLLVVYDYTSLEPERVSEYIKKYSTVHLLSWSLGVAMAHDVLANNDAFLKRKGVAVAINGTLDPISSSHGIDPIAFNGMIEDFDAESIVDFDRRMCRKEYGFFEKHRPLRDVASKRAELQYLYKHIKPCSEDDSFYDLAIIAKADMIIPARSQSNYWQKTDSVKIASPHYCFSRWQTLDELVTLAQQKVSEK